MKSKTKIATCENCCRDYRKKKAGRLCPDCAAESPMEDGRADYDQYDEESGPDSIFDDAAIKTEPAE